jgi:hypothetical protein
LPPRSGLHQVYALDAVNATAQGRADRVNDRIDTLADGIKRCAIFQIAAYRLCPLIDKGLMGRIVRTSMRTDLPCTSNRRVIMPPSVSTSANNENHLLYSSETAENHAATNLPGRFSAYQALLGEITLPKSGDF